MVLHGVRGCFTVFQGVTRIDTRCYGVFYGVSCCSTLLHCGTPCFIVFHGFTGCFTVFRVVTR